MFHAGGLGRDGLGRDGTGRDGMGRDRRLSFIRYRLDSMGTGTTSDADCQGDEKNFFCSDSSGGAIGLGTSREALRKGILWAQARLQMQVGHARATRRTSIFFQIVEGELLAWVHPERL